MDTIIYSPTAHDNPFPKLPRFLISIIWNSPSLHNPDVILKAVTFSVENLYSFLTHQRGSVSLFDSKIQLGVLWTLTLSTHMATMSVRITEQWENVIWKIIILVKTWATSNNINFASLESTAMKPWVLTMFCDPEVCPNPHLRLELLHLIGMWPQTYLQDAASGMQAAAGLVNTSRYLTLDDLIPHYLHASLFYPLKSVLDSLNKWGHLDSVAAAAVDQVKSLMVGTEAYFFNHLVHLLKQKVEATLAEYQARINNIFVCIEQYLYTFKEILHIYKMLVFTTPTAYGVPGLAQSAASFLVTLTASAVTVCSALQLKNGGGSKYSNDLVADLDDIYQNIFVEERFIYVSQILKRDHAQQFTYLSKQTTDFSFFHHLSVSRQDSLEMVPEQFIDSVTQAVMEAPVMLLSSKMVIDESTLVRLLLDSTSDPYTRRPLVHGSYSRLPNLQADILAWRNTPRALPK